MRSAAIAVVCIVGGTAQAERLGIGRVPTRAEIDALDVSVAPSGAGLPVGRGTAREGAPLYAAMCAACHGPRGEGIGDFPPLSGGRGTLRSASPVLTVGSYWPYATTLWDYTRRGMPYLAPGTLKPNEVYALTAFVLQLNGVVEMDTVLDARSLPAVVMPNRSGFVRDPRPDVRLSR
jgi:S-disulfanyl-L-cysteine oxidoreductase SoxD